MNEKSFKKSKIAIRGIQRNDSDSNQWPSDSRRRMDIFWENTLFWITGIIRYQPMKHSYDKIICFQNFPFDEELWLRYRCLAKKVLNWGRIIFPIGCGSLVREEFLKQPVGNSNTYDLTVWRIQCHDCSNTWNLNQMGNVKIFHSTNLRWQKSTAFFETKMLSSMQN